jgi:uncharacterized membrane protein YoaT (DUF817 family)
MLVAIARALPLPEGRFRESVIELAAFGWINAQSCVFAASFFAILLASRLVEVPGVARYDLILAAALVLQGLLIALKVETRDEVYTLMLFHALGFALEVFKTNPAIGSWSYPEPGVFKLWGVPLYSGFMYAAVASYMVQAWRRFDLALEGYPSHAASIALALAIYANFFTHHHPLVPDLRWVLAAAVLWLFRGTRVRFTPLEQRRWMPLPLAFVLIGFFVWIAENVATYFGAWVYPHQLEGWRFVGFGKMTSWALLVIVTFIIVADLKHVKAQRDARTNG